MKLVHPRLESCFDECAINVLAVENAQTFREFCVDIRNAVNGDDDTFVLSENDKTLNMAKCGLIVSDPLEFNINDKKLITKLYAELVRIADEKFPEEAASISEKFSVLFDKLNSESSIQIDWFNESPVAAILKAFGVMIKDEFDGYAERLINYISATVNLCGIKFIAFINLKSFFGEKELGELYKFLRYNGIFTLLLESSAREKGDGEFRVIIDNDLCEIIA